MQRAKRAVISLTTAFVILVIAIRIGMGDAWGMDGLNLSRFTLTNDALVILPVRVNTTLPDVIGADDKDLVTHINGAPLASWADRLFKNPFDTQPPSHQTDWSYGARLKKEGLAVNLPIVSHNFNSLVANYDFWGRWSNPITALAFLLIGTWIYFSRPYESSAVAMFVLGVSEGIYQLFQPYFRQVSDMTQPPVFWYDTLIAWLAGTTIMGALGHVSLVFPTSFADKLVVRGKTMPTWKWIIAIYSLSFFLFWALQIITFASPLTSAQKLERFQNNWQTTQVVGLLTAAGIGILHYIFAKDKAERSAIKIVVIVGVSIALLVVVGEKAFLLNNADPLLGGNLRRIALVGFPVIIARQIFARRIFEVDRIASRAALGTLVFGLFIVIQVILFSVLARAFDARIDMVILVLMGAVSFLVSGPLAQRLYRVVEQAIAGNRPLADQLIPVIEQNFDLNLPPEAAMRKATEAICAHLGLRQAEIVLPEQQTNDTDQNGRTTRIPLSFQGQPLGHLKLTFSPDRVLYLNREIKQLISHELGAMLYAVRVSENLRETQKRARAVEKKQQALRQQLHDGLGAELGGMVLGLDATKNMISSGKVSQAGDLLNVIKTTAMGMSQEVRAIARMDEGQMPTALAQLGLEKALAGFIQSFSLRFEPAFETRLPPKRLPPEIEAALYFITREAVNNVARHANATRCNILIDALKPGIVTLRIADNGRGMDAVIATGAGVQSMRQRISDLGGVLRITDNKPGTLIEVEIPNKD